MSLNSSDINKIYVVESRRDYIPITKKDCLWASTIGVKPGNLSLSLW